MDFLRQSSLVSQERISQSHVAIIGCGALGSATAMALAKMGVGCFTLFDSDIVTEINLPNQMYRIRDLNKYKVQALSEIIREYSDNGVGDDAFIITHGENYTNKPLAPIIIITTDSMSSRQLVWEQYLKQNQAKIYIEARMGAEEGQVYTITEKSQFNIQFYQERLYPDSEAKEAPCTAKAIIYNVFMIASLICRAYKAIIQEEVFPREVVFGLAQIHKYSFQIRV